MDVPFWRMPRIRAKPKLTASSGQSSRDLSNAGDVVLLILFTTPVVVCNVRTYYLFHILIVHPHREVPRSWILPFDGVKGRLRLSGLLGAVES